MLTTLTVVADEAKSPVGRYLFAEQPGDYVELRADKTFVIQDLGVTIRGTYNADAGSVTLKIKAAEGDDISFVAKWEGNKLYDPQGRAWTRQADPPRKNGA